MIQEARISRIFQTFNIQIYQKIPSENLGVFYCFLVYFPFANIPPFHILEGIF